MPLVVGGEATGVISLQNLEREHAFSEADLRLLMTLAGSLSVALENARLFEETRQRNAELALINDVQRGLAENLEMQAMYDLVGDRLQDIFDAQVVDIGVLDQNNGLVSFPYIIEGESDCRTTRWNSIGFRKHVLETRRAPCVSTYHGGCSPNTGSRECSRARTQVFGVFVPLVVGAGRPA